MLSVRKVILGCTDNRTVEASEIIADFIDAVNSTEGNTLLNGHVLSEYRLLKPFLSLITPNKVTLGTAQYFKNIVVRSVCPERIPSPEEVSAACYTIKGLLRIRDVDLDTVVRPDDITIAPDSNMTELCVNDKMSFEATGKYIPVQDLFEDLMYVQGVYILDAQQVLVTKLIEALRK